MSQVFFFENEHQVDVILDLSLQAVDVDEMKKKTSTFFGSAFLGQIVSWAGTNQRYAAIYIPVKLLNSNCISNLSFILV